jgi:hypothetical protein
LSTQTRSPLTVLLQPKVTFGTQALTLFLCNNLTSHGIAAARAEREVRWRNNAVPRRVPITPEYIYANIFFFAVSARPRQPASCNLNETRP